MDTDKLIDQLSTDLKPVSPLPPPKQRALGFVFVAIFLMILSILLAGGARSDLATLLSRPRFVAENLMMMLAGMLAAYAAFRLSVPDIKIRKPVLVSLLLATGLWMVLGLLCCKDIAASIHQSNAPHVGFHCLRDLTALLILPVLLAIYMMTRAAPVWTGWAGYGTALAVASFAAVGVRILCPNDDPSHLLLWHFLPVLGFSVLGVFIGRIILGKKT